MTVVISTLTEALQFIDAKDQNFALSLLTQSQRRPLSDKQLYWVRKFISRAQQIVDAKEAGEGVVTPSVYEGAQIKIENVNDLFDRFEHSKQHIKFPYFTVGDLDGMQLRLNVAGSKARFPGSLTITTNEKSYSQRLMVGRLMTDGSYQHISSGGPEAQRVADLLQRICNDPVEYFKARGKATGRCCFCGDKLSDGRSLSAGYGPVCARNYNLPWGDLE